MIDARDIAVLVGSLRKGSFSRKTAGALAALAPATLALRLVEIGGLGLYNQDLDGSEPPEWLAFRDQVRGADGVLFVTPEYNRSVPGVLKNAIDIGSRPPGASAWKGKPAGVVSVTPGRLGGVGANHHLRQSLVALDMPTMQQPEAYLAGVGSWFGEDGALLDEPARRHLSAYISAFAAWVEKIAGSPATASAG